MYTVQYTVQCSLLQLFGRAYREPYASHGVLLRAAAHAREVVADNGRGWLQDLEAIHAAAIVSAVQIRRGRDVL